MWNYSFAVPSLLVVLLYAVYYFFLPRIPIKMNRTFLRLLVLQCAVTVIDIVASWADTNYTHFHIAILYILNITYFVVFVLRSLHFYFFTLNVFKIDYTEFRKKSLIVRIPIFLTFAIILTTPFTHALFYIDESGYHNGYFYNFIYLIMWFLILGSYVVLFVFKDVPKRRRDIRGVFFYNTVLLAGSLVRLMYPNYLLMDTFCLIAITTIYLTYENPDFYLESRSYAFNSRALREYLDEINGKKKYKIMAFIIHNYGEVREIYGGRQMDSGISLIGTYLYRTFRRYKVFYFRSGRFVIVGDDKMDVEKIHKILVKRFMSPWKSSDTELYLEAGYAVISSDNMKSSDTILNMLITTLEVVEKNEDGSINYIDTKIVEAATKGTEVKKSLEYAVDNNKVEVFLQPVMDALTGKLVGAEALARIRDNDGKLVPPGLFIPIAEKNGKINQLGEQVFAKTCRFVKENDIKKMGMKWINVNLSPVQFMRTDLDQRLLTILEKYDIPPEVIHLEVTEDAMGEEGIMEKQIGNIKDKGFSFVLDDFGKGYSNISRLKKYPFINIKLDLSIVWDYCKEPDVILPNLVDTFERMGFSVTAEGIEDEKMAEAMTDIGCDYLQGYYYSMPLPMDEFVAKYGDGASAV
ncbi:EAL domain-containing protein [Butyrivibrio sp. XB500-5]|uniref:EAL domain-containing protein n=1 Tax=Butyrivibrio sp. XB500-5 TaxID=2364880 RepID=UPI000EA9948D|nr:EAL domain-containing protein [Butyrivibrio sp. XB500-5]RKM63140.1 EAL domain-containing protein [Butyrivibrio sp. XB500-5]